MPSSTYVAIATTTVGSGGVPDVTFSSISSSYTDLLLKMSIRNDGANAAYLNVTFNANTSSYTNRYVVGDGTSGGSGSSGTNAGSYVGDTPFQTSIFSNIDLYIPNYTSANNKAYLVDSVTENNGTTAYAALAAGLWSNTNAINSIKIAVWNGSNIAQHSKLTLYGIKGS